GATEVFEAPVDRLGRAVAGAGPVEEREHVRGALLERAAQAADLGEGGGNAGGDRVDHGWHLLLPLRLVGLSVGGDDALVDTPGRFDLDVLLDLEHCLEPGLLLLGEEPSAGVQGASGAVERVARAAAMTEGGLLNALPTPVQA